MAETVKSIPPTLSRYRVSRALLQSTADTLRHLSGGVRESVVLWQGRVLDPQTAEITKVQVPQQVTGPLHFNVPLRERLDLVREVSASGEFILVQLHTHPREAFHSEADDRMAITKHTGAISAVIPYFARRWAGDFSETAVFIHLGASQWRQMSTMEVLGLFEVIP